MRQTNLLLPHPFIHLWLFLYVLMSKRHENDNPQSSRQKFSKKLCFKYKQKSMGNKSLLVLLSANVVLNLATKLYQIHVRLKIVVKSRSWKCLYEKVRVNNAERILQIGSYSLVGTAKCRPGFQGLELATSGSVYCLCDEKQSIFYNFINIQKFAFFLSLTILSVLLEANFRNKTEQLLEHW